MAKPQLTEKRKAGAIWCLVLIAYMTLFWVLSHLFPDTMALLYLSPLALLEAHLDVLSYYFTPFLSFTVPIVIFAIAMLPPVGWLLLWNGNDLGDKLIRIPCIVMLVLVGISSVMLLYGGYGSYGFFYSRFLWVTLLLSILTPIFILKTNNTWNPWH